MADREKVIDELVEHIENALSVDSDYVDCVRTDLLQTAVALLKAQQPRVLTVGEIRSLSNCPVWRETKNSQQKIYQGWVLLYEIQKGMGITGERFGMAGPNGRVSWFKTDDYSKTWRCWSSQPTDEQRKAVAWDD